MSMGRSCHPEVTSPDVSDEPPPDDRIGEGCPRVRTVRPAGYRVSCAAPLLLCLLAGPAPHPQAHQPLTWNLSRPPQWAVGDLFGRFSTPLHSVWGRVVADIPDFNRELVADLAEG